MVVNYAAGVEAVGAFFNHEGGKGKAPVDNDEGPSRGSKKSKKKKKSRPIKREALDDDFITIVERKKPRGPQRGPSLTECSRALPLPQGRGQSQARELPHVEKVLRQPGAEEGRPEERQERRQGGNTQKMKGSLPSTTIT